MSFPPNDPLYGVPPQKAAPPAPYPQYPQYPSYPGNRFVPFDGPPHRGETVLVLGIIGIALPFVLGACGFIGLALSIPAWIMGQKDLKAIAAGNMDPRGKGMTQAGMVLGIVGTCFGSLMLLLLVGIVFFYLIMFLAVGVGAAAGA